MDPHCLGRSRERLLRGARAALLGLWGLRGRRLWGGGQPAMLKDSCGLQAAATLPNMASQGPAGRTVAMLTGTGWGPVWVWGPERRKPG